jgi:hypothetical protein
MAAMKYLRRDVVVAILLCAFTVAAVSCTRSDQTPESRPEPTEAPEEADREASEETNAEPGPEPAKTPEPVAVAEESCEITVDCDCPADSVVQGRRDSEDCCDLDCGAGEEIIEVAASEGTRFRCSSCGR